MKIAISGSTGLIGSTLSAYFEARGERVLRLVRHEPRNNELEIRFEPSTGKIDSDRLNSVDVVIHLAGESIASGRWTETRKKRILDSRVNGTKLISETIGGLDGGPKLLLAASGSNFYGDCGEAVIGEDEPSGEGFLADVCRQWEAATRPAARKGIRVISFRMGVVLAPNAGALAKMLPIFKLGLGGKIGSGHQYLPWVAIDDVARAIEHMIRDSSLHGPVNLMAPEPVTNRQFTKALGAALHRPALFPVPAFAVRLLFGQMGDETLLTSCRGVPKKLAESGFAFAHPEIGEALRSMLSKPPD